MRKANQSGNAYVEYLLLSLMVILGAIWLYDGANFQGVRGNVDASFTNMINEITTP